MAKLKQHHKDKLLVIAGIGLLLLLLLWWLAAHYHWGPYAVKSTTPTTSHVKTKSSSSGASGANGSNGTNGSNGSNGSSSTSATVGTPIFNLYGSVHNGETKTDVQGSAGGLDPNCVVLTSSSTSKQEVCTYQSGSKVVTINYLNGDVISVSKSGF